MLSLGDPHFAQGEGECCGTAIEVAATVRLRVCLRRREESPWTPRFPAVEFSESAEPSASRRYFMTMGIPLTDSGENMDLDLALAARQALLEMVGWLQHERGLTRAQGYVLASVAADLRIAEAVNRPNGLVVCRLPLDVFDEPARP
jgi:formamidase